MLLVQRYFLPVTSIFLLGLASGDKNDVAIVDTNISRPVKVSEGENVLMTCVVRSLGDHALIWKDQTGNILTVSNTRVTKDKRVEIIHDDGGDVYVLSIANVTMRDTGVYVCEVNTDPPTRSFHDVTVIKNSTGKNLTDVNNASKTNIWGFQTPSTDHDYTSCCQSSGVSARCLGFCKLNNILENKAGVNPVKCENEFPNIVACMADGKNHVPCCSKAGVPDLCQDMCEGKYTRQTGDARTHFTCSAFTAPTLMCISEGVAILPNRPEGVRVTKITRSSFVVEWEVTEAGGTQVDETEIRVKEVRKMTNALQSDDDVDEQERKKARDGEVRLTTVGGTVRRATISDLTDFTLYNVTLVSRNEFGESLPSYAVLVLTRTQDELDWEQGGTSLANLPKLPDTKNCCRSKNVTHDSCVDTFCDPHSVRVASTPDLMICAAWSGPMFSCLADGADHSKCCSLRGVPDICMGICKGSMLNVDYKHFRCVSYLPQISNCILQSHGVLPSQPRNFRFSNIGTTLGLLHWDVPMKNGDSIERYRIHLKKVSSKLGPEQIFTSDKTTFVLEGLEQDSSYETYVEAENTHGVGEFSSRIVFRTAKRSLRDLKEDEKKEQLMSEPARCCQASKVQDSCMDLCTFDVSMSVIKRKVSSCATDLPKLTRCSVGGRDHMPCCQRRGVPARCQLLCQGIQENVHSSIFTTCLPYIGNVLTCLEEGVLTLPPAVENFRMVDVDNTSVQLTWDQSGDPRTIQYEVYYKDITNNTDIRNLFDDNLRKNVTSTVLKLDNLTKGALYQFFVIARSDVGTSLPSSLIQAFVDKSKWTSSDAKKLRGVPTPPHRIVVTRRATDYVDLAWTSPTISHSGENVYYKVFYRELSNSTSSKKNGTLLTTSDNHIRLSLLQPNTQYVLYVTTVGSGGESRPSETVVTWTDPVVPAFAEAPNVHPSTGIKEGSSITILCIAMGSPTPTVTLYIGGHPIRSEVTRHMTTTLQNVTDYMRDIACHADNGYGTPMVAQRRINVERAPVFTSPTVSVVSLEAGQVFTLTCNVQAFPKPVITVGKVRGQLLLSKRLDMDVLPVEKDSNDYGVTMVIRNVTLSDAGEYFCKANNSLGKVYTKVTLAVNTWRTKGSPEGETCCQRQNVSTSCQGLCSLALDLDFLLYRPECYPEFHKLMKCASDGSDHRHCCSVSGVPGKCLDWCRGLVVPGATEFCALSHARKIAACFVEGAFTLPSPPRNVKVTPMGDFSRAAKVTWDEPEKNPDRAKMYRVLWREQGTRHAEKNDTTQTFLVLTNLRPRVKYELAVKAGNENGTSQLSASLVFTVQDYVETTSTGYSSLPSVIGVVVAVALLIPLTVIFIWALKQKKLGRQQSDLSQEITMCAVQESVDNPVVGTERDPTFVEELRLGRQGEGFKRFT